VTRRRSGGETLAFGAGERAGDMGGQASMSPQLRKEVP